MRGRKNKFYFCSSNFVVCARAPSSPRPPPASGVPLRMCMHLPILSRAFNLCFGGRGVEEREGTQLCMVDSAAVRGGGIVVSFFTSGCIGSYLCRNRRNGHAGEVSARDRKAPGVLLIALPTSDDRWINKTTCIPIEIFEFFGPRQVDRRIWIANPFLKRSNTLLVRLFC